MDYPHQLIIQGIAKQGGDASAIQLAQHTRYSRSVLRRRLRTMEEMGLIELYFAEDQSLHVRLTKRAM
jgi:uncharacterized membrane protein